VSHEDTIESILGTGGAVARRLGERYEPRPEQISMAQAVRDAIQNGRHLLVEAGTGVGKSFAYLVPLIEFATRAKKRVVISTHTIGLQEQLIEKDIPLLRSIYPDEFTAILVKGRNNYLCKRRLEAALTNRQMLFDDNRQFESLALIDAWSKQQNNDGSLATLPHLPDPGVWDEVKAEHGNCLGKRCAHFESCAWQAAKRRMNSGNILVVNHALFFSDLALRSAGVQYLPKYDAVVFDEAHTIEDVAGQHFAVKLSESSLRYQLRQLYDPRKGRGVLSTHGTIANEAMNAISDAIESAQIFFDDCAEWQHTHGRSNGRVLEPNILETDLPTRLRDAGKLIRATLKQIQAPEAILELTSKADRLELTAQTVEVLLSHSMPDAVYWIDVAKHAVRRGGLAQRVTLSAAPVDVSAGLREHLFKKTKSVVMTSATLCTGNVARGRERVPNVPIADGVPTVIEPQPIPRPFQYIAQRLGIADCDTIQLGSPFDFAQQATLYLETNLPDPNDLARFMPAAAARIEHYLRHTHGGAFVLFTSFAMLRDMAQRLKPTLDHLGLPLLIQGTDGNARQLLSRFRELDDAVLFGTSSFWQGIDVQGSKLRNVIITKLPFAVPDEPIIEAKLEAVTKSGGNAFMDLTLPDAIIRFKQGFGRLIRSSSDKGIVVLLDSRVRTKRYGKQFLDALPEVRRVDVTD
jgi:ATP-dependent DNA helicase DinG